MFFLLIRDRSRVLHLTVVVLLRLKSLLLFPYLLLLLPCCPSLNYLWLLGLLLLTILIIQLLLVTMMMVDVCRMMSLEMLVMFKVVQTLRKYGKL